MIVLLLLVFHGINALYQPKTEPVKYPQNYFISPIDIPISLSGNFGEPRRLHYHTGMDIRTNGEVGHQVYAAAVGYISRINVSSVGYGNALYITHPNGYVTVYGHLLRFSPKILERLLKEQYTKESFAVDFKLEPKELPVSQGEMIALSGNTGGSGGPHLHFEIRDSSENILNPALFGYNMRDNIQPIVNYLKFYPLDDLKYKSDGYRVKVFKQEGVYHTTGGELALNATEIGVAVNAYDLINNNESHMGINSIKLYDGEQLVFEYRIDKISFDERRYVLSGIDYPVFMQESNKSFYKCFTEPGNLCKVYPKLVNRGIINLSDHKVHHLKMEVGDVGGNISRIELKVMMEMSSTTFRTKDFQYTSRFDYGHDNEFSNQEIVLKIPKGCLFDNVYFKYSADLSMDTNIYSKVHQVDQYSTLSYTWFDIAIKAERLAADQSSKAIVVYKDRTGSPSPRGGKFENGFVSARTREFGTYYIRVDNKPPTIAPLNVRTGKNMRVYKKLLFHLSDNLSGVSDFDTYIDGKWVVTEYDGKSSTLTHSLDQKLKAGNHTFKIVATDERKNVAEYSINFKM